MRWEKNMARLPSPLLQRVRANRTFGKKEVMEMNGSNNGKPLEIDWDRIYDTVNNMARFKIRKLRFGNFEIERSSR
jgi:hypothetical protein